MDITTGTLGKALGGASGGYTSAKREIVELLRQRSRPYLFSNTVAPPVVSGAIAALDAIEGAPERIKDLNQKTAYFRDAMTKLGFDLLPGEHAIVPVMLYDAKTAKTFADEMLKEGVYVVAFSYPVVGKGKARIRTQMSAGLSIEEIDRAIEAFAVVKARLGL